MKYDAKINKIQRGSEVFQELAPPSKRRTLDIFRLIIKVLESFMHIFLNVIYFIGESL